MEGMLFERGKIVWSTRMACCNTRICSQCPCSAQATNWKAPFPPKCCQRAEHNTPVEVGPLRSFLVQPVCSTWTSCLLLPPGVFPANILQQFAIAPPKKTWHKNDVKKYNHDHKELFSRKWHTASEKSIQWCKHVLVRQKFWEYASSFRTTVAKHIKLWDYEVRVCRTRNEAATERRILLFTEIKRS